MNPKKSWMAWGRAVAASLGSTIRIPEFYGRNMWRIARLWDVSLSNTAQAFAAQASVLKFCQTIPCFNIQGIQLKWLHIYSKVQCPTPPRSPIKTRSPLLLLTFQLNHPSSWFIVLTWAVLPSFPKHQPRSVRAEGTLVKVSRTEKGSWDNRRGWGDGCQESVCCGSVQCSDTKPDLGTHLSANTQ